ncbi:MAG: PorT family protein [Bacteroidetes bacterium]|nr:PorT family protein [Bacteroidota bacterium]MBS1541555.1 PorT family protein [Bacteroidota bacterium]
MSPAHVWHQLVVHRIQVVLLVAGVSLLPYKSQAQMFRWARQHNMSYDDKKLTYGFSIGIHTSSYQIKYSNQFVSKNLDTLQSIQPVFLPGFSLGFLVNYKLGDFFDIRLMPKAGFYTHKLTYYYTNAPAQSQLVETTLLEFPLLLKYKSVRRGNVRMYMLGGFTPAFEASGKNDIGNSTAGLPIQKRNLSLDIGMGFDFYFPLFKLSQEIRFSRGIANMLGDQYTAYQAPLSRLNTNTISVYFIFQ